MFNFFFFFQLKDFTVDNMEWQDEISFNGNGYIDLNKKLISHKVDMNWELKIDLSTWINEGLILWQGASSDSVFSSERNDIAVGIAQGRPQPGAAQPLHLHRHGAGTERQRHSEH